jgi:hypothetical protein
MRGAVRGPTPHPHASEAEGEEVQEGGSAAFHYSLRLFRPLAFDINTSISNAVICGSAFLCRVAV